MKADLHMHGPIGFQDYWLKKQGYLGKNLLKEIADSCYERDLDICAITSEEDEIPKGSLHDRFNWLKDKYANDIPQGYETDTLGDNVLIVTHENKKLYLVNGQTVRTGKAGDQLFKGNTMDYLVIGTNQIPNHESIDDTVKRVSEIPDILGGAEHALCTAHGGMGREKVEALFPYMDFIEGHNSQLIWPVPSFVPKFGDYRRGLNKEAQTLADELGVSWIATSDAHRIQDAGLSYIEFNSEYIDADTGDDLLNSLSGVIALGEFENHCHYQDMVSWAKWVSKLMIGLKLGKV